MGNWQAKKLGEVINLKRGYDLPKKDRIDGEIPIVSSSGITGYHNEAKVEAPGVVTGRYGTLGEVFYLEEDFWPLNTSLYVQNFRGNDERFISYFLKTLPFADQNVAGAVPGVNRNYLHKLEVEIPDLPTQQKIASILSAFDDLIENNTRRIAILEEMARLIYREWFVHYRYPGHETDELVDSGTKIGLVPEGWGMKKLGTICEFMFSGGTPLRRESKYWDNGTVNWYKTKELWDNFLFEAEEKINELALEESSAREFPSGTILMAIYGSPTVGRLGITTQRSSCNQAALGMIANDELTSQYHLFFMLYYLRDYFNSISQGAAQQNISKTKVQNTEVVLPDRDLIEKFDRKIQPIFNQIKTLTTKNFKLKKTRDLLLPKLISGKVRV